VINYIDDLKADFCVFYRIDDIMAMPAEEFCRKAVRASAYSGVMAARVYEERERTKSTRPTVSTSSSARLSYRDEPVREAPLNDPVWAGVIEKGS